MVFFIEFHFIFFCLIPVARVNAANHAQVVRANTVTITIGDERTKLAKLFHSFDRQAKASRATGGNATSTRKRRLTNETFLSDQVTCATVSAFEQPFVALPPRSRPFSGDDRTAANRHRLSSDVHS